MGTTSNNPVNMQVNNGVVQNWASGSSSITGTLTVSSTITSTSGHIFAGAGGFVGSASTVILGNSTGAGTVYLRPNGYASATGQATISSAGNLVLSGSVTSSGNNLMIAPASSYTLVLQKGEDGIIQLFQRSAVSVGSVSVTSSATAFNTSSDYRLKTNYEVLRDVKQRVMDIIPYRGEFIIDPGNVVDYFIAHQLAEFMPNAVTGEKDGKDLMGFPVYQGVDQSKLVPLHHAALRDLYDLTDTNSIKIDDLMNFKVKDRVVELEEKLAAAELRITQLEAATMH
jgi:hypothetical protein